MSTFRSDILEGQVALITGGGTGIGREIVATLGAHGCRVAIYGRRADVLETAVAELERDGIECLAVSGDVREPEQVEAAVASVIERFGRLDIVVNNAAGNFPALMDNISYNGFRSVVSIDLLGTYNVSKAAYSAWLRDHGGNIVNISAPFELRGPAWQSHVAAAKAGVDSLTRTCAVEWGRHGIRVNAVMPGAIADTEGMARFDDAVGNKPPATNPMGRYGTVHDMADAVLFLVSDAASFVNGQIFAVDGGGSVDSLRYGTQG